MSITQWTSRLASLVAVLVMTSVAAAQYGPHHGAAQPFDAQLHQPFIQPTVFDPDYQFFAPAELELFGNGWQAKTGWFGKYDRTYLWVSRPQVEESHNQMDPSWGHRFSAGYMTSSNHGWSFEGVRIGGPNAKISNFIEQVNRFNEDDDPNDDNNQGGGGQGGGGNQQQQDSVFPVSDRNNPLTDGRDFQSIDTLNVATLSGFEINKTFRLRRLHNGSYLEPFFGFRYHLLNDFHRFDTYRRLDPDSGAPTPPLGVPNDTDELEEITIFRSNWENHMVGGQLGVQWYLQQPKWQLSSNFRVFAAHNFQSLNQETDEFLILYDGVGTGSEVEQSQRNVSYIYGNDDELVWGLDVRAEAAYELTRDISLTVGVQVVHYVQGIARGDQRLLNEEDLTMVGATFGVQVNK